MLWLLCLIIMTNMCVVAFVSITVTEICVLWLLCLSIVTEICVLWLLCLSIVTEICVLWLLCLLL